MEYPLHDPMPPVYHEKLSSVDGARHHRRSGTMKKKHDVSPLQPFFTLPLRNNPDKAVAVAYAEYVRLRGNDRGLGEALEFITRRIPELRASFSATHSHRGNTTPAAT